MMGRQRKGPGGYQKKAIDLQPSKRQKFVSESNVEPFEADFHGPAAVRAAGILLQIAQITPVDVEGFEAIGYLTTKLIEEAIHMKRAAEWGERKAHEIAIGVAPPQTLGRSLMLLPEEIQQDLEELAQATASASGSLNSDFGTRPSETELEIQPTENRPAIPKKKKVKSRATKVKQIAMITPYYHLKENTGPRLARFRVFSLD